MRISVITIIFIYYLSWLLSDKKRNNVMYHGVTIPRKLKLILNPFKVSNEFDLSSVIFELYAHASLFYFLSSLICRGMVFKYKPWLVCTFTVFCIVGAISFIIDTSKRESSINKAVNVLFITVLIIFALLSLLLAISIVVTGS